MDIKANLTILVFYQLNLLLEHRKVWSRQGVGHLLTVNVWEQQSFNVSINS